MGMLHIEKDGGAFCAEGHLLAVYWWRTDYWVMGYVSGMSFYAERKGL